MENEYCHWLALEHTLGDPKGLFDDMLAGDIDNGLITDYTESFFSESLGIESIIGTRGFKSAEHFELYSAAVIDANLSDWKAVELELYECWFPCLHDQDPDLHYQTYGATKANFYEEQFCYSVWSQVREPQSIIASKRKVFALRHKAYNGVDWPTENMHFARKKSYEKASLHIQAKG
ncbi:MAG: hypothetical protein CML20_14590 [Rheinheimera sp.]|jgi:hypothetical protein|nr:hypothetical protein [Rheinheimera sp.]|tara:strand:- start:2340 stop:2870 length:531 start_codon:yes stop_codon:yes gene_type:complete